MSRPKICLILVSVVIIFSGLVFFAKLTVEKYPNLLAAVIASVLVDLTNNNRLTQNIKPLKVNPTLTAIAQRKADEMAGKSYFSHVNPEGKSPWEWLRENNYQFYYAGENLAVNFNNSEDVVQAWLNSQGHRKNLLNDKFTEIGIAIATGFYKGRESIFVVQFFGQPIFPD